VKVDVRLLSRCELGDSKPPLENEETLSHSFVPEIRDSNPELLFNQVQVPVYPDIALDMSTALSAMLCKRYTRAQFLDSLNCPGRSTRASVFRRNSEAGSTDVRSADAIWRLPVRRNSACNKEAVLRLIRTYHTVRLPFLAANSLDCAFPIWFTQCGRVWFTNTMPRPCHATTMLFWKRLLKATAQRGMDAAWPWHGMCELASAAQRGHMGNLAAFGFFRLPHGVPRRLL
jgi:hypothetical protein